jgi:hypothetical protein
MTMTIQHTNRTGDVYYLHERTSKTGKTLYHFSKNPEGILANAIPEGYEVYENPAAQVFLRKIPPKIITDEEVAIVKNGIKEYTKLSYFIVDVKKNSIEVFLSDQTLDRANEFCSNLGPLAYGKEDAIKDFLIRHAHYSPMMRFVLINEEDRTFMVERWCFRGRVDDWIDLHAAGDLPSLVRKFCVHLDKESFYDLM